ncbi:hypothetical protein Pla110_25310 [Polystyrenella longa]|uniref:Uncharacterized protein n=1 Tax=Polystyrenella longa TaxID=2528007 RepID=A0A518CNJ0_9PLAN|nr:cytochrome C oxidase subunit IV family protein [Polystyrenella longa]QDU80796.1 hypothetical protein Pla110_25310 [Polystyrenella longa]
MSHSGDSHNENHGFAHALPVWVLLTVFFALVGLTCLTVWTAGLDFGGHDLVLAMVIATVKATMVMLFFMHLIQEKKFNILVFMSSFLFASLFLLITLMDKNSYEPFVEERMSETILEIQVPAPSE